MTIKFLAWGILLLAIANLFFMFVKSVILFKKEGLDDFDDILLDHLFEGEVFSFNGDDAFYPVKSKKLILRIYLALSFLWVTLLTILSPWYAFLYLLVIFPHIITALVCVLNLVLVIFFIMIPCWICRIPKYVWRGIKFIFGRG